jgi:hypothetical protein
MEFIIAHETKVAYMFTLLELDLVHQVESLIQNLYAFFVHNPKKFLEFQNLVDFINNKGNKLFKNVEIRWISMLFPIKRVYVKYCPLIVKIHVESTNSEIVLKKLNSLCDV